MRTVIVCKDTENKIRSFSVIDEATGLEIENIQQVSTRRQKDPDTISFPFKIASEPLEMVLVFGDGTEEVVHYKKGTLPQK